MPDINVVAILVAKPGSETIVWEALQGLVEPTRAEPGCVSYDLYMSKVDPLTFITIELWDNEAALDAHMKTPHIAKALTIAGEHLATAPQIHPLLPSDN